MGFIFFIFWWNFKFLVVTFILSVGCEIFYVEEDHIPWRDWKTTKNPSRIVGLRAEFSVLDLPNTKQVGLIAHLYREVFGTWCWTRPKQISSCRRIGIGRNALVLHVKGPNPDLTPRRWPWRLTEQINETTSDSSLAEIHSQPVGTVVIMASSEALRGVWFFAVIPAYFVG